MYWTRPSRGPVHVIRNDHPQYVILREEQYQELLEAQEDAYKARIREAWRMSKLGGSNARLHRALLLSLH